MLGSNPGEVWARTEFGKGYNRMVSMAQDSANIPKAEEETELNRRFRVMGSSVEAKL